jgi:hypothetical protein
MENDLAKIATGVVICTTGICLVVLMIVCTIQTCKMILGY